jgi:lysophospholipase L1-like esterase
VTNAAGVCWDRADFVDDGVHPSSAGRAKVAQMVHDRFKKEAWYRR